MAADVRGEAVAPGRAALEADQLSQLQALLAEILPRNRFYGEKLARAGFSAPPASLDEYFSRMPFTLKQELVDDQRTHPPYGTNLTYPLDAYIRFHQTSGTSGFPLRWLDTAESWSWAVETWAEVFRASGVDRRDRIFFAFSFGPFLGFWTAFDAGERIGALCLSGGGMSSSARLRTLLDNEATVLCCTPTYALRLGEVALEEGFDLRRESRVRTIIVAGEAGAGSPAVRARIEELWPGACLKDHHGMTEIGPVSFECTHRPGVLHVLERSFIPEVIDPDTGRHVAAGGEGELVLTNLGRLGSPLLRYRTGDRVRHAAQERCACGRWDLALEGGILGRTDDMVVVRGVNLFPAAVEEIVRARPGVAEYRVEVLSTRSVTELRLQLEPEPGCPDPDGLCRELEAAFRSAFHLRVPVARVPCGSLPRFEMKARRWVRLDPPGEA